MVTYDEVQPLFRGIIEAFIEEMKGIAFLNTRVLTTGNRLRSMVQIVASQKC